MAADDDQGRALAAFVQSMKLKWVSAEVSLGSAPEGCGSKVVDELINRMPPNRRAPSIQIIPTLGSKVCK